MAKTPDAPRHRQQTRNLRSSKKVVTKSSSPAPAASQNDSSKSRDQGEEASRELDYLWRGDKSFGIPEKYGKAQELKSTKLRLYRQLCRQANRSTLGLGILWQGDDSYLPSIIKGSSITIQELKQANRDFKAFIEQRGGTIAWSPGVRADSMGSSVEHNPSEGDDTEIVIARKQMSPDLSNIDNETEDLDGLGFEAGSDGVLPPMETPLLRKRRRSFDSVDREDEDGEGGGPHDGTQTLESTFSLHHVSSRRRLLTTHDDARSAAIQSLTAGSEGNTSIDDRVAPLSTVAQPSALKCFEGNGWVSSDGMLHFCKILQKEGAEVVDPLYGTIDDPHHPKFPLPKQFLLSPKFFIPIHDQAHWSLAEVDVSRRRIHYYDSMFHKSHEVRAKTFLEKLLQPFEIPGTLAFESLACPQQANLSDCGVFTIANLMRLSRGMHIPLHHEIQSLRLGFASGKMPAPPSTESNTDGRISEIPQLGGSLLSKSRSPSSRSLETSGDFTDAVSDLTKLSTDLKDTTPVQLKVTSLQQMRQQLKHRQQKMVDLFTAIDQVQADTTAVVEEEEVLVHRWTEARGIRAAAEQKLKEAQEALERAKQVFEYSDTAVNDRKQELDAISLRKSAIKLEEKVVWEQFEKLNEA